MKACPECGDPCVSCYHDGETYNSVEMDPIDSLQKLHFYAAETAHNALDYIETAAGVLETILEAQTAAGGASGTFEAVAHAEPWPDTSTGQETFVALSGQRYTSHGIPQQGYIPEAADIGGGQRYTSTPSPDELDKLYGGTE
jgi:hypothetical protein